MLVSVHVHVLCVCTFCTHVGVCGITNIMQNMFVGLQYYVLCFPLSLQPDANSAPTPLSAMLTQLRDITDRYPPPYILWTLFITACIAVLTVMLAWPESQRKYPMREVYGVTETRT